jgi:hypothetical protein
MSSFTLSTKALITLLALGVLSAGAIACAPLPDATPTPEENRVSDPLQVVPSPGEEATVDEILTPELRDRILQAVASEVDRPAANLRIAAAETATFDGCMGIYVPNQACTMIAIFGLRVVVTDGDQSWVYHTDQDGKQIVQNPTASGSRNGLIPDFIPPSEPVADPDLDDPIFRSIEAGDLGGYAKETVLLADGQLIQRENGQVVASARLAAATVANFQAVLEDQRFPNLHRLRYVTDAAFADYPTVRLSMRHLQTEYIDLAIGDAPDALQATVAAWESLVAEARL